MLLQDQDPCPGQLHFWANIALLLILELNACCKTLIHTSKKVGTLYKIYIQTECNDLQIS